MPTDTTHSLLDEQGTNTPAPWVPFTRAGCNVGAVGMANMVLENTKQDVSTVFGTTSPEARLAASDPQRATAAYVGIAIHCGAAQPLCAASHYGTPDLLPDEPDGYNGYRALYGHTAVAQAISPHTPLADLGGKEITDSAGQPGFPGFDELTPNVALSYVAEMQEHGVPVTYAYLADAHDNNVSGVSYGPGAAGYVAQLHADDVAFGEFFDRLSRDGITPANTLFVVTADEGDHFVGTDPTPEHCDGVHIACNYPSIGEVTANVTGLLATQQSLRTAFTLHADSAPAFYLSGNPQSSDPATRSFAQALGKLAIVNPNTGSVSPVLRSVADAAEMRLLHMVTADPRRLPTLVMFADPNDYLAPGAANCGTSCVAINPNSAWNHGDLAPEITTTWAAFVGPGVRTQGVTSAVWSDHTDLRPTILQLLGLADDYRSDGRPLLEIVAPAWLPPSLQDQTDRSAWLDLARTI